jgi:hypothetical protein
VTFRFNFATHWPLFIEPFYFKKYKFYLASAVVVKDVVTVLLSLSYFAFDQQDIMFNLKKGKH